jgi:hypothetical protein
MYFHSAVVLNDAKRSEPNSKRNRCAIALCRPCGQQVLADLRNDRLQLTFLPIVGQQHRLALANWAKTSPGIQRCG